MNKDINKFLIQAKINTYASKDDNGAEIVKDGSKKFVFKLDDFTYQDKYFGFNPFVGEEIVFKNNKVIWAMNYYGQAVSNFISAK